MSYKHDLVNLLSINFWATGDITGTIESDVREYVKAELGDDDLIVDVSPWAEHGGHRTNVNISLFGVTTRRERISMLRWLMSSLEGIQLLGAAGWQVLPAGGQYDKSQMPAASDIYPDNATKNIEFQVEEYTPTDDKGIRLNCISDRTVMWIRGHVCDKPAKEGTDLAMLLWYAITEQDNMESEKLYL